MSEISCCREAFGGLLETLRTMHLIVQTDVRILNISLRFRLLFLLVLPVFRLYHSTRGWGMPLFTPAGLLWNHPSYNHCPEGVCTPTLRHRGKNPPVLHPSSG